MSSLRTQLVLACAFSVCALHSLSAQPQGFELQSGVANAPALISPDQLLITSHGKAIISWDSFSIAEREALHFQQLGLSPAVLNRVLGDETSEILGRLTSNGAVYLLNPNGILIGPGALIETSSFIASTFDVLDPEFLAGDSLDFHGESTASVVNNGTIRCPEGNVLLAGANVENAGRIEGRSYMAAGDGVLFKPEGTQHLYVRLGGHDGELTNSGSIQGPTAELRAAKTVRHSGSIEASSLRGDGGQVYLVAEEGPCEVSGSIIAQRAEKLGGEVHLLGDYVHVFEGARVDVSAPKGQGVILVGGDYQGQNPDVKNANITCVHKKTMLQADATQQGNGGKVILWGNQVTNFEGRISARGGPEAGNGGFAEVSAHNLGYRGFADLAAPQGKGGDLLLDPNDISISVALTTGSFTGCPTNNYTITTGTATNNIQISDLQNQLDADGCTVTIDTTGSAGSGPLGGRININGAISWSKSSTLKLRSPSNITISLNSTITNSSSATGFTAMDFAATGSSGNQYGIFVRSPLQCTGGGAISLNGTSGGTVATSAGINVAAGGKIETTSGDINMTGVGSSTAGASAADGILLSGAVSVSSTTGNITMTGTGGLTGNGITLNIPCSTTTGSITINGTAGTGGAVAISQGATGGVTSTSGDITVNNGLGSGAISFGSSGGSWTTGGNVTIGPLANVSLLSLGGANRIVSTGSGKTLLIQCPVSLLATTSFDTSAGPAAINFSGSNATINGAFALTTDSGTAATTFGGAIGGSPALSSLTITNAGATTFSGAVTITNALIQTNAATGATTFTGAVSAGSATLSGTTFAVNNSFATTGAGAIAVTNSGTFTKGATGAITAPGGFSTSGAANLANNITTTDTALSIGGALTLAEAATVTLTSGTGTLSLTSVDGTAGGSAETLILNASGGGVSVTGAVGSGSSTSLTTVTVTNSAAITFGSTINITGALTQTNAATGATTFSGTVSAGSATLFGTTFAVNNSFATTGAIGVTNSGTFTKGATGAITAPGGFSTSGAANLANNITTTDTALSIGGALTLAEAATVTLTSGTGTLSLTSVDGTAGGSAETLILNASGGVVSVTGAVGSGSSTSLTTVTVTNSAAITFGSTINITGALTQTNAATGATTFSGAVSAGSATLFGTTFAVNNSFATTGAIGVTNSGTFTKNATGAITAPGGFSTSGAANLANNITTTNTTLSIGGNLTIASGASVTLSTQGAVGVGNITLSGTVNGTGTPGSLTLTAGTGTASIGGAVGGTSALSALTITATGGATLTGLGGGSAGVSGLTSVTSSTGITLNGTTYNASAQTYTGPVTLGGNITMTSNNNAVIFSSTVNASSAAQSLTIAAGTSTATFSGVIGSGAAATVLTSLSITGNGGVTLSGIGGGGAGAGVSGDTTVTSTTGITLNGTTYNASTQTYTGPVTLGGNITMTSNNNAISFSGSTSTINATTAGSQALTLTAGFGAITLQGEVGGGARLGALTLSSTIPISVGANITASSVNAPLGGTVIFSAGNTTISTSLDNGNINFQGDLRGTSGAAQAVTLQAGSGAITISGRVGIDSTNRLGDFILTASGTITLRDNILAKSFTSGGPGPIIFTQSGTATIINTSNDNGDISITGTINGTSTGLQALTLTAGSGAITLSGAVGGSTRLGAMSVTTTNATGLTIGANISANSFTTTGTTKTFLSGASIINTSANNGAISFGGTIDGTQNLTLTAGSGAITLSGVVGGSTALGAFTLSTSQPLTITNNISASALNASAVTNTVTFNKVGTTTINTTTGNGAIQFGGILEGNLAASNPVTLTAGSGAITLPSTVGATINLGALTLTTTGAISLGGNITASSVNASSTGPVTLTKSGVTTIAALTTGALSFSGTIDGTSSGAQGLTLTTPTGTITLSQPVGNTTRLGPISLTTTNATASALTVDDLTGSSITTTATSGTSTSTFNGTLDTNGASGITLSGSAISLNEPLNASGSGNIQITNSGALAIAAAADMTAAGSFTQIGAGAITTGGNITAGGAIAVAAPITLSGAVTWQSTGSNITLPVASTVNGNNAFTLGAESGTINLNSVIGGGTALGGFTASGLTINTAKNITVQSGNIAFTGAVILTNASNPLTFTNTGAGGITFNGTVDASSAGAQDLTLTDSSGTVSLLATMGGTTALGNLTVTANSILIGKNITASSGKTIAMVGPVTLIDDSIITTGTGASSVISFSSTINGTFALTATTRALSFASTVGSLTPLKSLVVDAVSISTNGNHTVSSGPMTYSGPVTLSQSTSFTNTGSTAGITFQSSSTLEDVTTGGISGHFPVTISATNSTITVTGDIDTSGGSTADDGKAVTLSASGNITVNGNITTSGGNPGATASGFDGAGVSIASNSGNISVQQIDTSGGDGTVTGGAAGAIALQPGVGFTAGSLGNIPNGRIFLNTGVTASPSPSTWSLLAVGGNGATDGTDGSISLFTGTRGPVGTVMSIATIVSSLSGNDITIDCGTFSMGTQEVMTALGSIFIRASSSIAVGDLIARNSITLADSSGSNSLGVTLLTHGTGNILKYTGSFDVVSQLQFVYLEEIHISGNLNPSGPLTQQSVSSLFSTPAEFQTQLIYTPQNYLLNFSTTAVPTPTPTPNFAAQQAAALKDSIIQSFGVANSEMFYLLQEMQYLSSYQPRVCFPARNSCLSWFPRWNSWLPQSEVE